MLLELRVENLLLIERAELRLAPGLNVLTGETGAGKTVLAHALDLLLGGRPRSGIVRPGNSEAYVEGVFAPPDGLLADLHSVERGEPLGTAFGGGAPDATEVVLARRVGADGRTRAYLNGRSATVADLRRVGEGLLAFYGQHEHRKLTVAAAQLEILDGFCGPEQAARRAQCAAAYSELARLREELDALRQLDAARERELDLLEHELTEIERAAPCEGELEGLLADRERLRRLDALRAAAGLGVEALDPDADEAAGVVRRAAAAAARLDALAEVDPELDALAERARALAIEAQDLAGGLRRYGERLDGEEGALEAVEERLATLERLTRRHGGTIAAVLEQGERAAARREELLGAAVALEQTGERCDAARATLGEHVQALRTARGAAAPRLADAVGRQLGALAMPDASFEVALSPREPGPNGGDGVEMLIAPNPGVASGPLREIASGGELSRVMLALTAAAASPAGRRGAARPAQPTLVFDEVDAGIGGHTARTVGERLRDLARGRQVLCITHLPQIASLAARHFSIVKDTAADPTRAAVVELGEGEVVSELVRMLGASEEDASARRHARELRRAA